MEDSRELSRRLEAYPHIRQALGQQWIKREADVDPVFSASRIARWLRIDGFRPDLAGLEEVLARLAGVPGIADRRRRLRSDPPGLAETLTELYFGAWLLERGHRFDWPAAGADFALDLGGNQPLRIEATTPRKAAWTDDLFERIDLITKRVGFAARLDHGLEMLPDVAASEEVVARVVSEALEALAGDQPPPPTVRQAYPEYELTITWTPDPQPGIRGATSPGPTSPYSGWHWVVEAARAKSHQLPAGEAGVLLIGTRQLPALAWQHFRDALQYWRPEDLQLDWSLLPPQVAVVVLWSDVLRRVRPWTAFYLNNPACPFDLPQEAAAFFQSGFPHPLQPAAALEGDC